MKIDTAIYGLTTARSEAERLRDLGVDGVFSFEGPHDVFAPLVLASQVGGLDLLTNVAIAFPRNPIHLAHQAWDLHQLSGGRFTLGLGTQIRPQIEKRFGVEFDRPVDRMREKVAAIKAIWSCWADGTRLDFRGDFHQHTLMTPMFRPGESEFAPPPIHVGALGPRMTRMVAESADGILVMPFTSERYFAEHTMARVTEGLAAAGRSADDFDIHAEAIVCVGRDEAEMAVAEEGTRFLLAFYGSTPSYRPVLEAHGWGDLQPELNAMTKAGRWDEIARLIDDEVLSTLAVRGTPGEVAAELHTRFGGADRLGFYTPYNVPDDTVAELIGAL